MDRRELLSLATLVVLGIIVRAVVFMDVGVNGDTGLYLYDAKQLLWGHRILIDYPSRSPVFEYALAAVLTLDYSPILSARAFMLTIALALGLAIYALTRRLHSHHAGLAAAAFYYLTPFPVVWGLWVKTEQAAGLLLVTAFIISLGVIDKDRLPLAQIIAVGVLFGLAFMIRRVAIVHIAAFALFIAYYRIRYVGEWRSTITAAAGVVGTAIATLLAIYGALAGFDPSMTLRLADIHAIALFESGGQGSLGWIQVTEPRPATAEQRSTIIANICQKCGSNTLTVFLVTWMLTLPVVLPLLVLLRSYLEPAGFIHVIIPVTFTVSGILGIQSLLGTPYWPRGLAATVLIGGILLVWLTKPPAWDEWWNSKYGLLVFILVSLAAGYLYRDRILYVTYFQDFMPYVVSLAGITTAEWIHHTKTLNRTNIARGISLLLLVLSLVVASTAAYPYQPDTGEDDRAWLSIHLVQEHGQSIQERTRAGDRVLTAQPLYVVESDRRIAGDLSRRFYLFRGWPNSTLTREVESGLLADIESGRVEYVVVDSELRVVYNSTNRLEPAVDCRFKTADGDQALYNRTNAILLERSASSEC